MPHLDRIAGRRDVVQPFVCSWSRGALDAGWVHVAGELDIATAPQLEPTLRERPLHTHLVMLDLRDLTFIDCSGVHTIVDPSNRARKAGHRLVLIHGSLNIERIFTLTGTSRGVELANLHLVEPSVQPPLAHGGGDAAA